LNLTDYFKNKKIYCVTDIDLDGISSNLLTRLYIKPIAEIYNYTITFDRQMSEFDKEYCNNSDIIIFIDLAPPLEMYQNLIQQGKEVFIFDHHETHYKELSDIVPEDHYFYYIDKCASKIFFDEIMKGRRVSKCAYQYIELVNTYDTWQQQSYLWKDAEKLQDIMYEYINWGDNTLTNNTRNNFFINKQIEKIEKGKHFYFTQYEEKLYLNAKLKKERNLNAAKKSLQIRTDNSGNKYGYFECNAKISIIANLLLKEFPELVYIVGYATFLSTYKNEKNGNISLRTIRDDFAVNTIAELWSGGGHSQASGLELPEKEFNEFKKGMIHLI